MERIIQKGNVRSEDNYDIRIIEENDKKYYYHFLKASDGDVVLTSHKPFNLKNAMEVSWDELPTNLREEHYKNVNPNTTLSDYERNSFLYGKDKADEIQRAAELREEGIKEIQSNITTYSFGAAKIYDTIGQLEKVKKISCKNGWMKYLVNDKWIIKTHKGRLMSIEEKSYADKQRKEWGTRVSYAAKQAKTSYNMATVVGNISDVDEAVMILNKIVGIVNSQDFYDEFIFDLKWGGVIFKDKFDIFLSRFLSDEQIAKLNFNNKFQKAVAIILEK